MKFKIGNSEVAGLDVTRKKRVNVGAKNFMNSSNDAIA